MRSRRVLALLSLLCLSLFSAIDRAYAEYPERTIRTILPFSAGGSGDALARLFANALSNELGQTVYIDNRPGAGGNIGYSAGSRADPDGYTLISVAPSFAINATLY